MAEIIEDNFLKLKAGYLKNKSDFDTSYNT